MAINNTHRHDSIFNYYRRINSDSKSTTKIITMVSIEVLEFGFMATIFEGGVAVGELLGVTFENLQQSLLQVYDINLYSTYSLN